MNPPVFQVCAADAGVQAALGASPTRVYPFGMVDEPPVLPYCVWQLVAGFPENYITNAPDIDSFTVQMDVYADNVLTAREAAEALRDAIEPHAHVVAWRGESRDAETKHYRYSFDVDWFVHR